MAFQAGPYLRVKGRFRGRQVGDLVEQRTDLALGAAGHGPRRVENVAVEGNGFGARRLHDFLRRVGAVAHNGAPERVFHRFAHLAVETHEFQCQGGGGAAGTGDVLGLGHLVGIHAPRRELVERQDGDARAQLALLDELLARLLRVHGDEGVGVPGCEGLQG